MREKTQPKVQYCDSSPPSWKVQPRVTETKGGMEGDLGGEQRSGCGMVTRDGKGLAGRQADSTGGGLGGGWTPRRRTTNRVQGGDKGVRIQGEDMRSQGRPDGKRSQGEDKRDLEQEEPGRSHEGDPRWS